MKDEPDKLDALLEADLNSFAASLTRLAQAVRAKGSDNPPAAAARLLIATDRAKAAIEKHAGYLLRD